MASYSSDPIMHNTTYYICNTLHAYLGQVTYLGHVYNDKFVVLTLSTKSPNMAHIKGIHARTNNMMGVNDKPI